VIHGYVAILAAGAVLLVLGVASARATLRFWNETRFLAPVYATAGIGVLLWVQFLVTWLLPPAGGAVAYLIVGVALIYVGATRAWTVLVPRGLPLMAIVVALSAFYLGLLYFWQSGLGEFELAALRFAPSTTPMPVDNVIPYLLSTRIQDGDSTHALILSWNGGDRPPLETGFILMTRYILGGLNITSTTLAFAAGFVVQLLWVPSLWALLRSFAFPRAAAVLGTVLAGVAATSLINTTYTWPKLLSAALVLGSLAILTAAVRNRELRPITLPVSATLFALGLLAHGAAVFSLPALCVLAIILFIRTGWKRGIRPIGVGVTSAVIAYLPWTAYQKFADPPGDRLLKWHLAGVEVPDDRSFLRTLIDSYAHVSPMEFIQAKIHNLAIIFDPNFLVGLARLDPESIGARRHSEYYDTSVALGVATPVVLALIVALMVCAIARRRPSYFTRISAVGAGLMGLCIVFWWAALFSAGGTVVHQGSHVWILVLYGISAAWLATVRWWLPGVVILSQFALTVVYYVPFFGSSLIRWPAVASAVLGALLLGVSVWITLRDMQCHLPRQRRLT